MIYPIILYGNDILRQQAIALPHGTDVKDLIEDLFATMDAAGGVGLAAPQIGKSIQLFVVDTSHWMRDGATQRNKYRKVYINPMVEVPEPNTIVYHEEGCLSIPDVYAEVPRSQRVCIRFFDSNWQLQKEELLDMPARVIQHEYDHLLGKLYIDYLLADKRQALEIDLANITKIKM